MPRKHHSDRTGNKSSYSRGVRLERAVARSLKALGYSILTMRSAGSRGVIDVLGIGPGGRLALVSAKSTGGLMPSERRALRLLARRLPTTAVIMVARYGLNGTAMLEPMARGQRRAV